MTEKTTSHTHDRVDAHGIMLFISVTKQSCAISFVGHGSFRKKFCLTITNWEAHSIPFGIRYSGFGIRDSEFGVRDSGFGVRGSGFGMERASMPSIWEVLIENISLKYDKQLDNSPDLTSSRPLVLSYIPLGNERSVVESSPNPEPRTPNPEPRTPNPEPRTPNPEPRIPNPESLLILPRIPNPESRLFLYVSS